jgi:hypothetical protein
MAETVDVSNKEMATVPIIDPTFSIETSKRSRQNSPLSPEST